MLQGGLDVMETVDWGLDDLEWPWLGQLGSPVHPLLSLGTHVSSWNDAGTPQ